MSGKKINPNGLCVKTLRICYQSTGGGGFLNVVSEMAERGYSVEWKVYNSKNYGVPQNRERVYIVGYYGERCASGLLPIKRENTTTLEQIIGGSQGMRVYNPNTISCTLSSQGGGMGAKTGLYKIKSDVQSLGNTTAYKNENTVLATGISRTLTATDYKHVPKVALDSNHIKVMPILTLNRLEKRQNGRRVKNEGEPSFTLTSQDRHGVLIKTANKQGYMTAQVGDGIDLAYPESETRRGRVQPQRSNTLTTSDNLGVLIDDQCIKIRKLTPRECWRLQGFTDEQFDKAAAINSNSQLYKQAGNAVTVSVVAEIGRHIMSIGDVESC